MDGQAAVDRELVDLGGTPATVLVSSKAAVNTTLGQAVSARPAVSSFDMVFFDVHSGARYLVKSGQIIKPLERMRGESGEAFSENGVGYKAVSKSVYLGSRED